MSDESESAPARWRPGHAIYRHPNGHECLYDELPSGAYLILVGIVREDGTIKRSDERAGRKQ